MVDLVVWVLEAEMAVLTEEEAVVFRGSWGLSCHGGAGRTFREVGALLRRILSGLRVDQGRRRRRKGSKTITTPTLAQTNRSLNLLGGSKEERCWFKKRRKEGEGEEEKKEEEKEKEEEEEEEEKEKEEEEEEEGEGIG